MNKSQSDQKLYQSAPFIKRHIGPNQAEVSHMLDALDVKDLDQLIDRSMPSVIRSKRDSSIEDGLSEEEVLAELRDLSEQNKAATCMIGQGYYGVHLPPVILRNFLENPSWYTAYTPYQAEISQGRLELLRNYQQMIIDLTGLEIANASLLDEATAAAEACLMMRRIAKTKTDKLFVDQDIFIQTRAVIETRMHSQGVEVIFGDIYKDLKADEVFGAIVQYPSASGAIHDPRAVIEALHENKAVVTMVSDPMSLVLLESPGNLGADIVTGSAQRLGVPMGCGGPHAAYMACREKYIRSLPGRIIGTSVDHHGNPALRMALQTREQHIRRDKATSNICTAQVLLANIASLYAVWHGAEGLRKIASEINQKCAHLASILKQNGITISSDFFFDTLTIEIKDQAEAIVQKLQDQDIDVFPLNQDSFRLSIDETTSLKTLEKLLDILGIHAEVSIAKNITTLPTDLTRISPILTHPVFNKYQTETEMMRYLRHLADKDLALDRTMIPLGSCTMKLNAAAEMIPITWDRFANVHPFAPDDRKAGYAKLVTQLADWLADITGYDAVSMQPNAGSQGEFAGLLAVRRYLDHKGENHRNICLIPSSAHGTNPASAIMAGMKVIVTKCDSQGNVDVEDLREKIAEHSENLAALMITYPSTHGVFEDAIGDICKMIHDAGGQVYLDGANLNALVGLARPGEFGSDVSHINLHKTFCIPHGGGGPGMGPIGVRSHLEPFLPGHPLNKLNQFDDKLDGCVSAAAWGSASILPISWAYIRLLGGRGLIEATQVAILSANYIMKRLSDHYPVLYSGKGGFVAHECILDFHNIKETTGISVEDVAKRLIDYGFHAPTMSFPVPETLMIEPTESENLAEIDRLIDAMISIRQEIKEIETGSVSAEDSVLKHAPHTAKELIASEWNRSYSREQAAYPFNSLMDNKYWPPVGRVNNVHGDRNLICGCPPITDFILNMASKL